MTGISEGMDLFRKILIPVDGSPLSEEVLSVATPLFDHAQEPVELLRVVAPLPLASPLRPLRTGQERMVEQARAASVQYLGDVAARFDHVDVGFTQHVEVGEPSSRILDRAEEVQPTLIAMSTHGRSGVSRWVRGSVAEKVLRQARVPLFLAQTGCQGQLKRVLVPLDGSTTSARIVPLVRQFALAFAAEVVLLHVGLRSGGQLVAAETGGVTLLTEKMIHDLLEPCRQDLERAGVPAQTRADFGLDPAARIMEAVEQEEISVIAMTSHGRTGLDRWMFGSVAEKVLRQCSLPLLLLPLRGPARLHE